MSRVCRRREVADSDITQTEEDYDHDCRHPRMRQVVLDGQGDDQVEQDDRGGEKYPREPQREAGADAEDVAAKILQELFQLFFARNQSAVESY